MHTLRHTAAMNLLTAGVDTSTIALWLGHEQERTTHIYLHADLEQIQRAGGRLARMRRRATSRRLRPPLTSGRDLAAVWVPTVLHDGHPLLQLRQRGRNLPASVAGMHRGQHELGPSSLSRCSR
jgi:hypothetical protein